MSSRQAPAKHRFMRRLARGVLGILAVLALALVVLGFIARPGSDGVSRVGGHPVLTVLSGSMTPAFRPGDLVVDNAVTPHQAAALKPGDVITFHVPGSATQMITHRIVAFETRQAGAASGQIAYQTKGDANNTIDPEPVSPSQVVGVYKHRIPLGGYFFRAIQQKLVFLLLILLPLLYIAATEIAKRWNEPQRKTSAERAAAPNGLQADNLSAPAAREPVLTSIVSSTEGGEGRS